MAEGSDCSRGGRRHRGRLHGRRGQKGQLPAQRQLSGGTGRPAGSDAVRHWHGYPDARRFLQRHHPDLRRSGQRALRGGRSGGKGRSAVHAGQQRCPEQRGSGEYLRLSGAACLSAGQGGAESHGYHLRHHQRAVCPQRRQRDGRFSHCQDRLQHGSVGGLSVPLCQIHRFLCRAACHRVCRQL